MEEGETAMKGYVESNSFTIPVVAEVDGLFKIEKAIVKAAIINPPSTAIVNFKVEVVFQKFVSIGYNGDMKRLVIMADYLDDKGGVIKSEKFYRGVGFMGKNISQGLKETLHGNPGLKGLGALNKIVPKIG